LKYDTKFIIGRLKNDSANNKLDNGFASTTWNRLANRNITMSGKAGSSIRLTKIWNLNPQRRAKTLLCKGDSGGLGWSGVFTGLHYGD